MVEGRRASTVRARARADLYSRFLATVPAANAVDTSATINAALNDATRAVASLVRSGHTFLKRSHSSDPPTTASTTSPASGRYMRRSAPTSVAIGTMLDVGARVTKTQTPRKPSLGCQNNAAIVIRSRRPTNSAYGITSPSDSGRGKP